MFRIKICGITKADDAHAAVDAGADAIGLNFYEKSKRCVSVFSAQAVSEAVPSEVTKVGVFVNETNPNIHARVSTFGLSAIQLHGDETPEFLSRLIDCTLIRARRMDERGVAGIAEDLEACGVAGRVPDALLVDAYSPGEYGGTGETVSWPGLADFRKWMGEVPLILAGGLTPENVAEAIRTVRPHGVDVASGVELSPGVKCPRKMRLFVDNAKSAFDSIGE